MNFDNKAPDWGASGTEPSDSFKQSGFAAGYKPPAAFFNWFWNLVSRCISELQQKLSSHATSKNNPHGVTAAQVGLGNVSNVADKDKRVAYADASGSAAKVDNSIVIRLKGGNTEGTDKFTYNGSGGKAVNITAASIGAASGDLSNVDNATFASKAAASGAGGIPVVAATSADGVAYAATVPAVTQLTNGMLITIVPNITSASKTITLNVNGLGDKMVRLPLSFNNAAMTTPKLETYFTEGRPITLQYDANYLAGDGIWKTFGKQRSSAQDLYGTVPIEGGGTDADNAADALKNLGVTSGTDDLTAGVSALATGAVYLVYE